MADAKSFAVSYFFRTNEEHLAGVLPTHYKVSVEADDEDDAVHKVRSELDGTFSLDEVEEEGVEDE